VPGLAPPGRPSAARRAWAWFVRPGQHPSILITLALLVSGAVCALLQAPLWDTHPLLAAVNLATSETFICTGLILRRDPRNRAVAWALIVTGALRSVDFTDALGGPWPFYTLIFGGMDRLAGAYALLRYPGPRLTRPQRVFIVTLGAWMIIGRTLATALSTPRWDGYPSSSWWWTITPDRSLAQTVTNIVNAGQGVLGLTLLVLLIMRWPRWPPRAAPPSPRCSAASAKPRTAPTSSRASWTSRCRSRSGSPSSRAPCCCAASRG
jgi:hypothetical protein